MFKKLSVCELQSSTPHLYTFVRVYYVFSSPRHGIHSQYEWILKPLEIRPKKIKITKLVVTEMLGEVKTRKLHFQELLREIQIQEPTTLCPKNTASNIFVLLISPYFTHISLYTGFSQFFAL